MTTQKLTRIDKLRARLAKEEHDAAIRGRLKPLRAIVKKLDLANADERDRDVTSACRDLVETRMLEIEADGAA
jgi:hypothetical protein